MIAYNKIWLANKRLQAQVKKDQLEGCLGAGEYSAIAAEFPVGFYTPGPFARVGLFILTCVVISFGGSLLTLMFVSGGTGLISGWTFILALLCYGALEAIARGKHHYRSGVDDALLFLAACLVSAGLGLQLIGERTEYMLFFLGVFFPYLFFAIRFADTLMSAASVCALLAFIFFASLAIFPWALPATVLIMMGASAALYLLSGHYSKDIKLVDYRTCLRVIQFVSLLSGYGAGNYYLVQTTSTEMGIPPGAALPFPAFFWAWTMAVPLIYLGFGIKRKDVILLRCGLLLIGASIVTLRAYYHVLPLDVALAAGGAFLLGIAYSVMRYLRTPKYGFTGAQLEDTHSGDHLALESLIVAGTFAAAPVAPANKGVQYGGGDSGGSGSSGSF